MKRVAARVSAIPWWVVVFGVALALRVAYLLEVRGHLRIQHLIVDSYYHDQWARTLAAGDWLGQEAFFRAPLYPYLVGLIYAAWGPHPFLVRLLQALLGSISALLVYYLGNRLYGKLAGVAAGIMAATYWVFIYHEGEILITSLSVFLHTLLLVLLVTALERPRGRLFFLAGVVLGLAAVARPNILLFGVIAGLWLIFGWRGEKSGARRFRWLVWGVVGTVLMVAPVTIRNAVVSGDLVLISWQGGSTFYAGNNPQADGVSAEVPGVRTYWWEGFRDVVTLAEESAGRTLSPSEISRYWYGRAGRFLREEPASYLGLQARKLGIFWYGRERGDDAEINLRRRDSRLLSLLPLGFGVVAPLGLLGLVLLWRGPPASRVLFLYLVGWMISVVVFFVTARFRLPVVPVLMIWAGAAVSLVIGWLSRGDRRRAGISLGALAALLILLNVDFYGVGGENRAQAHFNQGVILARAGDWEEAAREYREALRLAPGANDVRNNLATAYLRLDRRDQALAELEEIVDRDPGFARAHYNMGVVYDQMDRPEASLASFQLALSLDPHLVECWFALGTLYQRRGEEEQAKDAYEGALAELERTDRLTPVASREEREGLRSWVVRAHLFLGQMQIEASRVPEAIVHFERAVGKDPLSPGAHRALGEVLIFTGRVEEGLEELRTAIGLEPEGIEARYTLALHYAEQGRFRPAAHQLEEILQLVPDHRGALFNLGIVRARQQLYDLAIEQWERLLAVDPGDEVAREHLERAREVKDRH